MRKIQNCIQSAAGSILVEYVLMLCFLGITIYTVFFSEFYSSNGYQGVLGNALQSMMQRILEGIAMPIP